MFLYNSMWAWNLPASTAPHGVVLHAVGCPLENAESRQAPTSRDRFILFDPDSYLWELDSETCGRAVKCLESYPWIPTMVERTALPSMTDEQVAAILGAAADWQKTRGVSRIILPTPLISESDQSVDEFLRWLDTAISVAAGLSPQSLIAVGVSEVAIRRHFDTILDHLTARRELPGIYIFAETSRSSGSVAVNQDVARMLLMASHFVGQRLGREVVVNFADTFGLACLAVGAAAFAGGYERKCRRLNFENFEERDGGGAFPKFFALGTTAYYRPEKDLQRIRDARLLRLLEGDRTASSAALFEALKAGGSARDVPTWRESRNNVAAAKAHLIERLCGATDELVALRPGPDRIAWVLEWLQNAELNVTYLGTRFEDAPLDDDGRHVRAWRASFESFIDEFELVV